LTARRIRALANSGLVVLSSTWSTSNSGSTKNCCLPRCAAGLFAP